MAPDTAILPADLALQSEFRFRGHIDIIDQRNGIEGWAVNLDDGMTPITLELFAGRLRVARTTTDIERSDIRLADGPARAAGFRFSPEALQGLRGMLRSQPDARLEIRVAGTEFSLPAPGPLPSVAGFCRSTAERGGLAEAARLLAHDLPAALALLRAAAEPLQRRPLPARPEATAGFIEAVFCDDGGLVWFIGWIRGAPGFGLPGLLVEGAKHPAGVAFAGFHRADLPEGATGILGVMQADWVPQDPNDVAVLHLGEDAGLHVRSVAPLARLSGGEWLARFDALKPGLTGPAAPALRRLFGATTSWTPDNAPALGVVLEQSVDRVLVIPGFGALVEGWVLSPSRRASGMLLRLGDRVLHADAAAMMVKPRPDLAAVLPGGAMLSGQAGFVTAFRGDVALGDLTAPVLKLVFADGISTNHRIDARALRILGYSAAPEEVLQLFPEPQGERFFPALATALAAELRPRLGQVTAVSIARAPTVLIRALADDREEVLLTFAEAMEQARRGLLPAIALLARPGEHRPLIQTLFQTLETMPGVAASLFFLGEPELAPYALAEVLARLDAGRFAFFGPGLHPDATAIAAVQAALAGEAPLAAFGLPLISGSETLRMAAAGTASAEAFVADTAEAGPWLEALPIRIGGLDSRVLRLPAPVALDQGTALRVWGRELDRFSAVVNATLAEQDAAP